MELFIFVRIHARQGSEAAVEKLLAEVMVASRAESGCVHVHAFRATRDPRLFYIHSCWVDEAAFDLHATLPHTVHFIEAVQPLIDHPFEVTRSTVIA